VQVESGTIVAGYSAVAPTFPPMSTFLTCLRQILLYGV